MPNKISIVVLDIAKFKDIVKDFKIGSIIEIDGERDEDGKLVAIVENFKLAMNIDEMKSYAGLLSKEAQGLSEDEKIQQENFNKALKKYIIEAVPIGVLKKGEFLRGGNHITIPPQDVKIADKQTIELIYKSIDPLKSFDFCKLSSSDIEIRVPVDGNKFFNKHIGIVGSTGSGKSWTVASVIQKAVKTSHSGLNNSHVVIFDVHDEYKKAFDSNSNTITIDDLKIPCWLLNTEELQELFIESSEEQSYRQVGLLKQAITLNKVLHTKTIQNKYDFNTKYESLRKFKIREVLQFVKNKNREGENGWVDEVDAQKKDTPAKIEHSALFTQDDREFDRVSDLFNANLAPKGNKTGTLNGSLINLINRFESKINDPRYNFLFNNDYEEMSLEQVLHQFLSYEKDSKKNITRIDLSGLPFEVLSLVISVISRLIFEYGYYYKKFQEEKFSSDSTSEFDTPILLVYEEIHKYAPRNDFSKYKSAKTAIERIVKEGRKYGVSAMIVSQRPPDFPNLLLLKTIS